MNIQIGMLPNWQIVQQHPDMIKYVDFLQKKNAESLSFYPKVTFERESKKGRIFLGLLNDSPAGYVYVGAGKDGILRCHQVCIEYDARRRLYGAALIAFIESLAINRAIKQMALRCGSDLEANDFWSSLGYVCIGHELGGVRRMRTINLWRKALQEGIDFQAIEPARHATDATIWKKHKQTGLITQFARGAQMQEYRKLLTQEKNDHI